jgi:hypothetical protein
MRDGSATGAYAEFAVRTYVMPGIRSGGGTMDMRVVGSLQDTPSGSEFAGLVSVPIGRWTIRVLAGWLVFVAIMTGASGGLAILVLCVILLVPAAVAWALVLRHNQRVTPRDAGSLSRFLQAIAAEAEAERTPQA